MPKVNLTDAAIQRYKAKPGERIDYFDSLLGHGFALRVSGPTPRSPEGHKSWVLFYRFSGQQKRLTIEPAYPALKLGEAREAAREALHALKRGEDPAAAKQQTKAAARAAPARERRPDTIENVVELFTKRHLEAKHRAPRYIAETRRLFHLHVLPRWRDRELSDITKRDIVELLDEIADRGTPIAANRTHAAISGLFSFAIGRDIIQVTPFVKIPKPGAETKRERALSAAEIAAVWKAAGETAYPFGPYFRMLLATAQRREEVGRMRWADIDLAERTWTIPSAMTKPGRAHVVPLSPLALRLLQECPRTGTYVFSSGGERRRQDSPATGERRDAAISGYSYGKHLVDKKLAAGGQVIEPWTIHDLRRTAATMMAKLGVARFTLSRILNHVDQSVTGIYDRHEYLAEKRQALETWSQFLENLAHAPDGNVVPLRRDA